MVTHLPSFLLCGLTRQSAITYGGPIGYSFGEIDYIHRGDLPLGLEERFISQVDN